MNTMLETEKPNTAVLVAKVVGGVVAALAAAGLVAFVLLSDDEEVDETPAARVSSTNVVDPRKAARSEEAPPEPEPIPVPEPEPYAAAEPGSKGPRKIKRGSDTGLLRARVDATPEPEPEPKAPVNRPAQEIKIGFARAAKTAKQCGERHGAVTGQRVTVQATINKAGTVISANATGSNRSTPLGKCVAAAVKTKARFIKWGEPLEKASYIVKL